MHSSYESMITAGVGKKFRQLEEDILTDVARRMAKAKDITASADWQLNRYKVLGNSTADIEDFVKKNVGDSFPETFEMYDRAIEQFYTRNKPLYEQVNQVFVPYEQNQELQQLVNALVNQSNEDLYNISRNTGFMVEMGGGRKVFTPLSEVYNGYLDQAIVNVASGAFDYNTMLRKVVKQMTDSGLRTVDYSSGRSNRVDVAARRALLTGLSQLAGQVTKMNATALGTDKYEVDWHPGARPSHAEWQGRVYTEEELVEICGLGEGDGLLGWNCRHTYYPFIDGISERNYTDEWLEEKAEEEARRVTFRGRDYNAYEATQRQRYLETNMRAQREKVQMLKAGKADPDDILNEQCKYQAQLDEYKAFSARMNLPEQRERIYADLRGRVAPSREQYEKWLKNKESRRAFSKGKQRNRTNRSDKLEKEENSAIVKTGSSLKMDLQFFANSSLKNQEDISLMRGIRSFEKRIREHKGYLDKPEEHVKEWNGLSDEHKESLKKHWEQEIKTFKQSIEDRKEELKRREGQNE